jgi:hypothetical protein
VQVHEDRAWQVFCLVAFEDLKRWDDNLEFLKKDECIRISFSTFM